MMMLKRYPVTLFLSILTSFVFLLMQVLYGSLATTSPVIYEFGGMFGLAVKAMPSELWRLVTPIFVHIGFSHFFVNALTLYFVGQMAEDIWGSRQFLLLYMMSGVMGNALTLWATPNTVAAGASTSLFGLFAAIIVLGAFGKNQALKALGKTYQTLIGLNLVMNLFMPNVSLAGHLGGILGGVLGGIALRNQLRESPFSKGQRFLAFLVYLVLLLLILIDSLLGWR